MLCPNCGEVTKVVDSRPGAETVVRRRGCTKCKYRFSSIEVDMDVWETLAPPDPEKIRTEINDHLTELKYALYKVFKV